MKRMILGRQIFLNSGRAAKSDGTGMLGTERFGSNWFYFFPHFNWNKGIPWRHACTDFSFTWLFYWVGATIYWGVWKHDGSSQANSISS